MLAQLNGMYIKTRPAKAVQRLISYALFEGRPLTTKGQWINPLLFALFRIGKNIPAVKEVIKPVFIVGTGRSGTTILGAVLSMHRAVGFLNEPKALWHVIYPEEDVIGNYTAGPALYRLHADHVAPQTRQTAHRLYSLYLALTFSQRVVDKYPELIFRIPFVRSIFPDAKFVFLVRNGWDTCHSIEQWSMRLGVQKRGEVHDWWGLNRRKWNFMIDQLVNEDEAFHQIKDVIPSFSQHTDMAAVEWVVTMREGLRQMKTHGDCIRMLRFEDLATNPRRRLQDLLKFCDLSPDETFFRYAERTLRPTAPHPQGELHHAIHPLFEETMRDLGYGQSGIHETHGT